MSDVGTPRSAGSMVGLLLGVIAVLAICVGGALFFRPELFSVDGGARVANVVILPQEAVTSGAQWRVVSQWQGIGQQDGESFYLVEFRQIPGWEAPAPAVLKKGKGAKAVEGVYRPVQYSEKVILRLAGSSTIGSKLAPDLAQQYLVQLGADEVRKVPGPRPEEVNVQGIFFSSKEIKTIAISAKGTPSGFAALRFKGCDIAMAARPATAKDVAELVNGNNLLGSEKENLFALDGVSIVTHPKNPVQALTVGQIRQIFSGEITNWNQVGGPSGPIKLFVLGDAFGAREFFEEMFLTGTKFSPEARIVDMHSQLTEFVVQDPFAIGFCSIVFLDQCKEVAIKTTDGASAFDSAPQNVRDGKYPATRKMFLYPAPDTKNVYARDFIRMAQAANGQALVKRYGFVTPDLEKLNDGSPIAEPANATATASAVDVGAAKSVGNASVPSRSESQRGGDSLAALFGGDVTLLPEVLPELVQPDGKAVSDSVRQEVYSSFRNKVSGAVHLPQIFRFDPASSNIDTQAARDIATLARAIQEKASNATVLLVGFSDAFGDYAVNLEIARHRAATVAELFRKHGVRSVEIVAAGEEYPLAPNLGRDGRERNRRVEIWLR